MADTLSALVASQEVAGAPHRQNWETTGERKAPEIHGHRLTRSDEDAAFKQPRPPSPYPDVG